MNTRHHLKKKARRMAILGSLLAISLVLAWLPMARPSAASASEAVPQTKKPNILVIFGDESNSERGGLTPHSKLKNHFQPHAGNDGSLYRWPHTANDLQIAG